MLAGFSVYKRNCTEKGKKATKEVKLPPQPASIAPTCFAGRASLVKRTLERRFAREDSYEYYI